VIAFAPGRVNLIGDHTDHTGGLALPVALDLGTTVEGEEGGDTVVLTSDAFPGTAVVPVELGVADPAAHTGWARYVAAVVAEVQPVNGFAGHVSSTLPIGAGLSSSASLELAVAAALGAPLEPRWLAAIGQRAEHRATGVPCGILDQLAIASGVEGHALLLDTTTLDVTPVPVPDSIELVVVDSGERRVLERSAYAARSAEAKVASLDSDDPVLRRRARHTSSENARVLAAVDALRAGDAVELGRLFTESHRSLADDFDVSTPTLDALVARLLATPGVRGARLTGAGFGGCVVAVAEPGAIADGWVVRPSRGVCRQQADG
jgi:galactokinase